MHVSEIMTRKIVTIAPTATIGEATELLIDRGVSGLPVVGSKGELIGILTEFALMALAYDQNVAHELVSQHMTREVLTVDANDPVSKVADVCILHRVRRLPVLEGNRLVGLVSRRDVLKSLYTAAPPFATC